MSIGLFQKNFKQGGWGHIYFSKRPPGIFRFIILPFTKQAFTPANSAKLCDTYLVKIPRSKNQDPCHGNSTWVFPENSCKFHLFFNWPLEFSHFLSSKPLGNLCPQSSCHLGWGRRLSRGFNLLTCSEFFWNSPLLSEVLGSHIGEVTTPELSSSRKGGFSYRQLGKLLKTMYQYAFRRAPSKNVPMRPSTYQKTWWSIF